MYDCGHPAMQDFRVKELGLHAGEAFVIMTGRCGGKLNFKEEKICVPVVSKSVYKFFKKAIL